jgi:hypothetical protein
MHSSTEQFLCEAVLHILALVSLWLCVGGYFIFVDAGILMTLCVASSCVCVHVSGLPGLVARFALHEGIYQIAVALALRRWFMSL